MTFGMIADPLPETKKILDALRRDVDACLSTNEIFNNAADGLNKVADATNERVSGLIKQVEALENRVLDLELKLERYENESEDNG